MVIVGWGIRIQLACWIVHQNMEIGLCWFEKGTNKKWTCDLVGHSMIDLEIIIVLAFMACIVDVDVYELHTSDESLQQLYQRMPWFYILLMIGVQYHPKVYMYTYVNEYICT